MDSVCRIRASVIPMSIGNPTTTAEKNRSSVEYYTTHLCSIHHAMGYIKDHVFTVEKIFYFYDMEGFDVGALGRNLCTI